MIHHHFPQNLHFLALKHHSLAQKLPNLKVHKYKYWSSCMEAQDHFGSRLQWWLYLPHLIHTDFLLESENLLKLWSTLFLPSSPNLCLHPISKNHSRYFWNQDAMMFSCHLSQSIFSWCFQGGFEIFSSRLFFVGTSGAC